MEAPDRPTAGTSPWRVVQLATDPASGYCGRLLATLGAEVWLVEPPGRSGEHDRTPDRQAPAVICEPR